MHEFHDVLIIGGGPAGVSAAVVLLGKQLDLRVITPELGGRAHWRQRLIGQLADEYLPGEEAIVALERQVSGSGCLLRDSVSGVTRTTAGFDVHTRLHGVLHSRAVLIATGASPIELTVPGAAEFRGRGLSYSVATHGGLAANKTSIVIGNTLRAVRGVCELAPRAEHVYLAVPESVLLISPLADTVLEQPNVDVLAGAQVRELAGGSSLEEAVVEHEGALRRLAVDAAFADLGLYAASGPVRPLLGLAPGQFIGIDKRHATAVPGLFAAGDVTTAFGEHALVAIGEGAKAALAINDHVLIQKQAQPQAG